MRLPEVKSFRDRNQVVTGVVGLLLVAALTASVFAVSATGILEHRYQLTAVFETTGGLTENADVRLAGVPIGTVTSVDPDYERGVVVVTFEVDEGIDLGPGMTAEIASATLLGGYYLRLDGEVAEPHLADLDRDDEIGRLSRTFRDAFERLKLETERVQTTDARRREMVASVSHDLRTPLTALIGQLETIRLKGEALSDPARREMLERALQNAQHLRRLTEALAELARLDNPDFKAQPEPIAIGELADDVVQRFAASAQGAGVTLSVDYPDGLPLTRVDAALVERAPSNLLDNALRVTPAGGRVTVKVRPEKAGVRVEVVDTGPGVLPEDQPKVFDRFFQTSRARDQRGASGLGLAIVKRVAELHGGQAGLRSEPGRGSTFFIELPLSA